MAGGWLELKGRVGDDVCIGVGVGKWVVGMVRRAPEPEGVDGMVGAVRITSYAAPEGFFTN